MRVCQQGISVSVLFLFRKTSTSASWNFAQYCKSIPGGVGCLLFSICCTNIRSLETVWYHSNIVTFLDKIFFTEMIFDHPVYSPTSANHVILAGFICLSLLIAALPNLVEQSICFISIVFSRLFSNQYVYFLWPFTAPANQFSALLQNNVCYGHNMLTITNQVARLIVLIASSGF